jgi:RimJ/RimL family protein N-acetyltransferase
MPDARYVPMLQAERIWLRPLEERDLEAYRLACTDRDTASLAGFPHPKSETNLRRWYEQVSVQHGSDAFYFTVCRTGEDAFIGTAVLWHMDQVNGSAEISMFIGDKELWGHGYGTEALNALVDFGFGELPLERIWLKVYAHNPRAQKTYVKAGFVTEGVMRNARRHRGGFSDSILMSQLRDEWAASPRPKGGG